MKSNIHKRGFASMDRERNVRLARRGGVMAHLSGHAHEFTSEQAVIAGRKGGYATARNRR